jgi:hypothetical protein
MPQSPRETCERQMIFNLQENTKLSFCRVTPVWVYLLSPHGQAPAMCSWQEQPKLVLCSLQ